MWNLCLWLIAEIRDMSMYFCTLFYVLATCTLFRVDKSVESFARDGQVVDIFWHYMQICIFCAILSCPSRIADAFFLQGFLVYAKAMIHVATCRASFIKQNLMKSKVLQRGYIGCNTGNGEKLSSSQAQLGQATCLADG